MTPLASFLPFVLPHAQSVPDMLAEQYIRQAAREFCQETRAWRTVTEIDVAGEAQNDVPVPSQSEVFEIAEAWFRLGTGSQYGKPLYRVSFENMDPNLLPTGTTPANGAVPEAITQIGFNSIIVAPPASGKVKISAYLMPTITADSVPDFLFAKYATIIADGALGQLLLVPGQPYTAPDIAGYRSGLFRSACETRFNLNRRGQQRAPARVRSSYM